jgi:hypothetical protein
VALEHKGILSPFTIFTSVLTGSFFPLLGSFFAAFFIDAVYWEGVVLTAVGGFLAHYLLSHTIHDLYHARIEARSTLSTRSLKGLLAASLAALLAIAVFLAHTSGWPVLVFSVIGAVTCLYAEGLLHHESQMAFAAMFLVLGAFYVQMGYVHDVDAVFSYGREWLEAIVLSLFAFFSQYGWLLFYRLDDYGWDPKKRNQSILLAKLGLVFLVLLFALHAAG